MEKAPHSSSAVVSSSLGWFMAISLSAAGYPLLPIVRAGG